MNSRLKEFSTTLGGIAVLAGIFLLGVLSFGFLPRISEFIYRFANPASGFVFLLDLLILPFALSRRLRPLVGTALLFSSYLFGVVLWTFSALITYSLWGFFGLVIGLIWLGVGVVPIAVIAAALHREWSLVFVVLGEVVMVFGCRALGVVFIQTNAATVDKRPNRRMVLGGGLAGLAVLLTALVWWTWHLYGTVRVQAADFTCLNFTGLQDDQKAELVYGYLEGVQAELEKDEPDILVAPSDARHPMWWVLPEDLEHAGLQQRLDEYCKSGSHQSQKLLDAFLSIAYQKTGSPDFGLTLDNKKTDP